MILSGLAAVQAQDSYITIHALNPEGIELGSIQTSGDVQTWLSGEPALIFIDTEGVFSSPTHEIEDFYDEFYNWFSHNWPIPISAGTHTITAYFNGIEKEQVVNIEPGETRAITFTFERTEFDLLEWINSRDFPRTIETWTPQWVILSTEDLPSPTDLFDYWFVQQHFDGWYPIELRISDSEYTWTDYLLFWVDDQYVMFGVWANRTPVHAEFYLWANPDYAGEVLLLCPWVTAGSSWWESNPPELVHQVALYGLKMSSVPYDVLGTGIHCGGGGPEPPVTPPTVSTSPATAVTKNSATLSGSVTDDGGEACQYRFRYRQEGGNYL
jgi:hypothetical protein